MKPDSQKTGAEEHDNNVSDEPITGSPHQSGHDEATPATHSQTSSAPEPDPAAPPVGAFGTPAWQAPGGATTTSTERYISNPFTVVIQSFGKFFAHWKTYIGLMLLGILPIIALSGLILAFVFSARGFDDTTGLNIGLVGFGLLISLALVVFFIILQAALTVYSIAAARGQSIGIKDCLRRGWQKGFGLFGMMLILALAVMLGFIALIIPGLILLVLFMLWYFQAPFIYIDQDKGIFEALKESKRRSREMKIGLEHLGIIGAAQVFSLPAAIPLLGLIYSLFFTPVNLIAYAYRYTSAQALIDSGQPKPATSSANIVLLLVGAAASVLIFALSLFSSFNDAQQRAQETQQGVELQQLLDQGTDINSGSVDFSQ